MNFQFTCETLLSKHQLKQTMPEFIYTHRERQKNWTVQDAINSARAILDEKNVKQMCINAVSRLDPVKPINMIELNQICKDLVDDSVFYKI